MNQLIGDNSLLSQCKNQAISQNYLSTGYWVEYPWREMTAGDLGLLRVSQFICDQRELWEDHIWVEPKPSSWSNVCKVMLATNPLYRSTVMGDAPYSFWLGADG